MLIERAVDAREIECAVLGNDDPVASIPGEILVHHKDGFYSYDAKYVDPDGASWKIPADIPAATTARVQELAVATFRTLELSGLARVDFFLSRGDGALYVNEVNTIPGFTAVSMYPKMWEASGLSQKDAPHAPHRAGARAARRAPRPPDGDRAPKRIARVVSRWRPRRPRGRVPARDRRSKR